MDFKWFFICIGVLTLGGYIHQGYKEHLEAQIQLERIKSGKCNEQAH